MIKERNDSMTNKATQISDNSLYNKISSILEESRKFVATTVNTAMIQTYFEIGRLIVEEEQHGNIRAEYGKETLKNLSIKLTQNNIFDLHPLFSQLVVIGKSRQ